MSKKKHGPEPIFPSLWGLPAGGADAHAHLDLRHFDQDRQETLRRATATGLSHIGNVFLSADAYRLGRDLFAEHPQVFFLLGIHPTEGEQATPEHLEALREAFCGDARLKAVGEIGLDYHWRDCPPATQKTAFAAQLHLARALGKPVVIHSRDAFEDSFAILEAEGFRGYPLLWHCFGGGAEQARRIVDAGWHISIPGPVTYPANHALRDALAHIPPDRLLAETDCPYLAPAPYRGQRNEPALAACAVAAMAEALACPLPELWLRCGDNAKCFFGLT